MSVTSTPAGAVAIGLFFAERLGRLRALTREETDRLAVLADKAPARCPLRRWTPEQDSQLLGLWRDGLTAAEIGIRLSRSTDAVHTRIKRLKMKEIRDG